jgi:hypothetical protein
MKLIIVNREQPLEVIDLAAQAGSIGPDELVAGVEYASGFTVTLNPPVPWRVIYSRHEIGQRVMQAIDALPHVKLGAKAPSFSCGDEAPPPF